MIWRSLGAGGWIHAMGFNHESKVYKLLVTHSKYILANAAINFAHMFVLMCTLAFAQRLLPG